MSVPVAALDPVLAVENLSLALGVFALRAVDLALEAGEVVALLGPNGAGKSVLLETVAGFHAPASGRISIRGRDVAALPPERRHVGFIFQNFGLFPHLTVAENVAVGLAPRGRWSRGRAASAEVGELLERFGLGHLAARDPADLSPGEKQRTALARSLATKPDLFLLDEPFSALDARTTETLRAELKNFLKTAGIPALFVTHDERDVTALAHRAAILKDGKLVQHGSPDDLFRRPVTRFVAEFLGVENILSGRARPAASGEIEIDLGGCAVIARADRVAIPPSGRMLACIRAEEIGVTLELGGTARANRFAGHIVSISTEGPMSRVRIDAGVPLIAYVLSRVARAGGLMPGAAVTVEIDPAAIHLIPDNIAGGREIENRE